MNYSESIFSALASLWQNKLRSGLTLLSVAVGVSAIVGIGSGMDKLSDSVLGAIDQVGGNSFVIKRTPTIHTGANWKKYQKRPQLKYDQCKEFKQKIGSAALVSISDDNPGVRVKYGSESTDPTVTLWGVDENYFVVRSAIPLWHGMQS